MIQLIAITRITSCIWCAPAKEGEAVWVRDGKAAQHLIEHGFCTLPKAKPQPAPDPEKPRACRRSDSWPLDRFAVIEPVWKGETVVCIGGGPSVTQEAVNLAKGRARVIAINNSYLLAPWADICYFADARWWEWHKERPDFKSFAGQKVTIGETGSMVADPEVFMLHNYGSAELSEQPNGLRTGANSGYQAINIAVLAGAKRVLLLGYDMKYGPGKKSHWHEGHPLKVPEGAYSKYARNFASMVPQLKRLGVAVINCTPGSLIDCFPRGDLASLLAHPG